MFKYISIIALTILFVACDKPEIIEPSVYNCSLSFVDESTTHPNNTELQNALDEIATLTPGVQVSVRTADGKRWNGSAGMADIPNNIPLQPCHKLMVGSVSKIYTGVLIMQLHDEGILSVDDLLKDWLEADLINNIENADVVSLRQLLNHTSGIKDYLYKLTQREKLEYIYGKSADHAPDEAHTYSNSNYVLLGLVIEKARNMTLWDAVDTYISQPMGFENTVFGTHDEPIPAGTARPYWASRNQKYIDIIENSVSDAATGDGGIAANTQELNVFIENVFNGTLVSNEALSMMRNDSVDVDGQTYPHWENEFYGLGLEIYHTEHGVAYGHTGSTSSYTAYLLHFPEKNMTLSIAYNGETMDEDVWHKQYETREKILDIMFE